jgi:amino acid transporter
MYTCIGLLLAGLVWGLPQALMTAELSSAIPANGGPVIWVERVLGRRWGFVNALLIVFNQITDINLYPTLLASYFQTLLPGLWGSDARVGYAIKVAVVVIAAALNIVGVEALSTSAAILTGFILLPFFLLPFVAAMRDEVFDWSADGPSGVPPGFTFASTIFFSTVLWNMQGWTELGSLAGDVENAGVIFPRGMALAAVLVTFCYAAPVLIGAALSPDTTQWEDGFFVVLVSNVSPWLGVLTVISAALANMSTLLTSMAAYSRTLQAVARLHIIPAPFLADNATRFKTPVGAITVITVISFILMFAFDFSQLVVVDSAFYILGQVSVLIAFLRLRFVMPHLVRPYSMPGGTIAACISVMLCLGIAACALIITVEGAELSAAAIGGAILFFILLAMLWEIEAVQTFIANTMSESDKKTASELDAEIMEEELVEMRHRRTRSSSRGGSYSGPISRKVSWPTFKVRSLQSN